MYHFSALWICASKSQCVRKCSWFERIADKTIHGTPQVCSLQYARLLTAATLINQPKGAEKKAQMISILSSWSCWLPTRLRASWNRRTVFFFRVVVVPGPQPFTRGNDAILPTVLCSLHIRTHIHVVFLPTLKGRINHVYMTIATLLWSTLDQN